MNITEHEMRGLITGKAMPADIFVGESLAAYLVRKFTNLHAERDALAAENAALNEVISAVRGVANKSEGIAGWHLNGEVASWDEILPEIEDIETPATDAYVNSVRADGVDMFISELAELFKTLKTGGKPWQAVKGIAMRAASFAAQLRAGEPS